MASIYEDDTTKLTHTFQYDGPMHKYSVKWCSLGDPKSQPLIFIHGTPWSSRVWVPFAVSLSRQFHVYLFDRPGFGDSAPEIETSARATYASQVIKYDGDLARQTEVFSALYHSWEKDWEGQKLHVIAHDNAGLISLRAFILHECQFASLCLINVVAIGPFGQSLFKVMAEDPEHFARLPDIAFEGIIEAYIKNAAHYEMSKDIMEMLKAPWLREGGQQGFLREMCQANSRSTDAVEGRYAEVGPKLPVKIIWGKEDKWIPVESAWKLGKALGAKEVVVVDKARHLSMIDQGAQIGVELGRWLSAV